MNRIRWYGPTILLLITALVIMIAGPRAARDIAYAHRDANIQLVREGLENNPTLAELSDAFRKVATIVEPSVVHIQVYKRVTQRDMRMRDEMLRRMFPRFPDLPEMEPQEPTEEDDEDAPPPGRRDSEDLERYNVPQPFGNGSGWVFDKNGHVITNNHVVQGADRIEVRFNDDSVRRAKVVGVDLKTDVAVIKVEGDSLHPAAMAKGSPEQGDIVFAFGSPFGFEFSMSQGIVSAQGRKLGIVASGGGYENFIQTDAAINRGNSGGPLTNIYGEVVGMNTAIATRTGESSGLGFAIPVEMVKDVATQIIEHGKVVRGFLGVMIRDLDVNESKTFGFTGPAVAVEEVLPDGPAKDAGLKRGDIVARVDGTKVASADELRNLIAKRAPGSKVKLEVFRGGKATTIEATVGELPDQVARAGRGEPGSPTAEPEEAQPGNAQVLRKLGLDVVTLTRARAEQLGIPFEPGVLVGGVRTNSLAAEQGIRRGNVITEVLDKRVQTVNELVEQLNKQPKGAKVRLSVIDQSGSPHFVFLDLPED